MENRKLIAVRITCGVAYDCYGRELIQTTRKIALPASGPQTLLIRYRETARFPRRNELSSACSPGGNAPLSEQPDLVWKPMAHVTVRDGVPLAQLSFDAAGVPSVETRAQLARPLARPRIGSGATVPDGTPWELWSERVGGVGRSIREIPIGMQVTIDTSAAGFTEKPCYFAWLPGVLWEKSNIEFFPVPLQHFDRETYKQFRFRLWMPTFITLLGTRAWLANQKFGNEYINFARKQRLYVCWMGIQPNAIEAGRVECPEDADPECHSVNEG